MNSKINVKTGRYFVKGHICHYYNCLYCCMPNNGQLANDVKVLQRCCLLATGGCNINDGTVHVNRARWCVCVCVMSEPAHLRRRYFTERAAY